MNVLDEARQVLQTESQAILTACDRLDGGFSQAVDLLFACKGRVVVSGLGKSGLIGRKIAATLASTGTPAIYLHPAEGVHGDLGMLVKGDAALIISYSGETDEILELLPNLKRIGAKVVALTGRADSSLANYADAVIDISVEREACSMGVVPTASTAVTLALGDALAVVLLKKRGFRAEDFAVLHPGGSLGKKLLLKVDDLMHAGEANAVVRSHVSTRQAVIQMTAKRLGAVCVVDEQGVLVGVLTDGDLRRALERRENDWLEEPVSRLMTGNPITIESGRLAAEAVHLMEDRPSQIAVLPVVDDQQRPIGLLRLHDLVKAGVA